MMFLWMWLCSLALLSVGSLALNCLDCAYSKANVNDNWAVVQQITFLDKDKADSKEGSNCAAYPTRILRNRTCASYESCCITVAQWKYSVLTTMIRNCAKKEFCEFLKRQTVCKGSGFGVKQVVCTQTCTTDNCNNAVTYENFSNDEHISQSTGGTHKLGS